MIKHISFILLFLSFFACNSETKKPVLKSETKQTILQNETIQKVLKPATWKYSLSKKEVAIGQTVDLIFEVAIDDNWYLYSSDFDPNLGPNLTVITFEPNSTYKLIGKLKPIGSKKKYDDIWGGEYTYFKHKALFKQTVKILDENVTIKGSYTYQVCTEVDGKCIGGEGEFEFKDFVVTKANGSSSLNAVPDKVKENDYTSLANPPIDSLTAVAKADTLNAANINSPELILKTRGNESTADLSLMAFIFLAFFAGFSALYTPCVFPMIPMTVTLFTNSTQTRKHAIIKALVFGTSIVVIYTLIGVICTIIFGVGFANALSTHWIPNVIFTVIFIFFALSMLGMYEITLPSSLVNKVDREADKGGYYGVFFMAMTIVVVSFSCTVPFVSGVLIAAKEGELLRPAIGMMAYSSAFAIPFALFAIFPELLKKLPKSGGWLNVIKVTFGFVELAFALKFLSVADQVMHWGILDRDIFLSLWIVIFTLLGIYLLGKIRLPHDSPVESISIVRLVMAIASLFFAVYLVPGLWGAPLKPVSGYLPPLTTQDFNLSLSNTLMVSEKETASDKKLCNPNPRYSDFLKLPHGLKGYFEYKEAIACAKERGLPLFIDFTGHGCVNCRKMEANVWSDPQVLKRLKENYVVLALYVDDHTKLPEDQWVTSSFDGKVKKTMGAINVDIQATRFKNNAQPFYILLDPYTETELANPVAFKEDITEFIDFLDEGTKNFKLLNKK